MKTNGWARRLAYVTGLVNQHLLLRKELSFAKNSSADMSLRHNAFITVMQAAELRDLDDPSRTRDLARKWTLLVEAQMGPRSVVVSEIRSQSSIEMLPVQDHEMIQAVSSNG